MNATCTGRCPSRLFQRDVCQPQPLCGNLRGQRLGSLVHLDNLHDGQPTARALENSLLLFAEPPPRGRPCAILQMQTMTTREQKGSSYYNSSRSAESDYYSSK